MECDICHSCYDEERGQHCYCPECSIEFYFVCNDCICWCEKHEIELCCDCYAKKHNECK